MSDNVGPAILLTRPSAQSERFAAEIGGLAEVLVEPLQEIVSTGPLPPLDPFVGLIFTSENAVRVYSQMTDQRDLPAWCVGTRTQRRAEEAGLVARAGGGDATSMTRVIVENGESGPFLHLHGHHTRGDIVGTLNKQGVAASGAEIYEQVAIAPNRELAALAATRRIIAPLFSPRSAGLLAAHLGPDVSGWTFLCLSDAVRRELPNHWQHQAFVTERATSRAMVVLLKRHISH